MRRRGRQLARDMFEQADLDGNGTLELGEIVALAAKFGHRLNNRQGKAAMKQMDIDGNGSVDFDEFYKWWTQADITSGPEVGHELLPTGSSEGASKLGFMFTPRREELSGDSSSEVDEEIEALPHIPDLSTQGANLHQPALNDTLILGAECLDESPRSLGRRFDRRGSMQSESPATLASCTVTRALPLCTCSAYTLHARRRTSQSNPPRLGGAPMHARAFSRHTTGGGRGDWSRPARRERGCSRPCSMHANLSSWGASTWRAHRR
jgi:hypothetical protein